MRRRLIYSLAILFLLFAAGAGISMFYSYKITQNLESVINLHRIEIIRQNLVINTQQVQSNLYAEGTIFGKELDQTVESVVALDSSINSCVGCHHNKEMSDKLHDLHSMVHQYKEAISYLVTSTSNEERVSRLKSVAVGLGDSLISKTQDMALIADRSLSSRTVKAVHEIRTTRLILLATIALSLVIALTIAATLTREITRPVDALVNASRMIAAGHLDHRVAYAEKNEFGEVAESFNAMSTALEEERNRTDRHIRQLSGLHKITILMYMLSEISDAYQEICGDIARLFGVNRCALLLRDAESGRFVPCAAVPELTTGVSAALSVEQERVHELIEESQGGNIMVNCPDDGAAFAPLVTKELGEANFLVAWLHNKAEVIGAIRLSHNGAPFTEEDGRLLTILANHLSVAMENAGLYRSLRDRMTELRETQEQLIQSAKLAAIGELASNIAHEINNPLTSIIGFAEIAQEDDDMASVRSNLAIIEKESIRARDIVRDLLTFARKKPLELIETDVNAVIREVMPLIKNPASKNRVRLREEYGDLPATTADPNQLKQVFLNIITNGIASMAGRGGELGISTSALDGTIVARFSDTGCGIPRDVLDKIFEPFFTTKKDAGTGLGLSISHRIIRDHGGIINVESAEGSGTTFTVRIPVHPG